MENKLLALKRKDKDINKLLLNNFSIHIPNEDSKNELYVLFNGPKDSPYENVSKLFLLFSNILY